MTRAEYYKGVALAVLIGIAWAWFLFIGASS